MPPIHAPWSSSITESPSLLEYAREMRKAPTPSEQRLWQALRGNALGVKFRRQHVLAPFIVDFYAASAKLVVEVDGEVHVGREARDASRTEKLIAWHGVRVVRVQAWEVRGAIGEVIRRVVALA